MRAVERLAKAGSAFYLFGKVWKSGGVRGMGLLACWLLSALWGTAGERGLHLFTLHQYVVQLNELRVSLGLPPLNVYSLPGMIFVEGLIILLLVRPRGLFGRTT